MHFINSKKLARPFFSWVIFFALTICSQIVLSIGLFPGGDTTSLQNVNRNSYSHPSSNMEISNVGDFQLGNALFRRQWSTGKSSSNSVDGLGPLFNSRSCQSCHLKDGRGHPPFSGITQSNSLVIQLQDSENNDNGDDAYGNQLQPFAAPGLHGEGQLSVFYEELVFRYPDDAEIILHKPNYNVSQLADGPLGKNTVLSPRIAPQMIGVGLLEAIEEEDILRQQDPDDINRDGISGRANFGYSLVNKRSMLGRFGWKASAPTIADQTAVAFSVDMGLSTPLIRVNHGDCTAQQSSCLELALFTQDTHEDTEVSQEILDLVVFYSQNLAVPESRVEDQQRFTAGRDLFNKIGCESCHTQRYVTSRIVLSNPHFEKQIIFPYTDLLLHDMGEALADRSAHGFAQASEWRTSPLWGIGLAKIVNPNARYLHDGRAGSIEEAILWHDGEGLNARSNFVGLSVEQRQKVLYFLRSL